MDKQFQASPLSQLAILNIHTVFIMDFHILWTAIIIFLSPPSAQNLPNAMLMFSSLSPSNQTVLANHPL